MPAQERKKSNRFIIESIILLVLLGVFLSIVLWSVIGQLNTLNYKNQQKATVTSAEAFIEEVEQTIISIERLFEASDQVTNNEYQTFCDDICNEDYFGYVVYISGSDIEYVYPETMEDTLYGVDVLSTFEPAFLIELQTAMQTNSIVYVEESPYIIFYKPVLKDGSYTGMVGTAIYKDQIASSVNQTDLEGDVLYYLDDIYLLGNATDSTNGYEFETIYLFGQPFNIGSSFYSSTYDKTIQWGMMVEALLFIVLTTIFVLIYRYHIQHIRYVNQMSHLRYHHMDSGLPNRESLYRDFEEMEQDRKSLFVAYGLFNNLKFIHYKYGHSVGSDLEVKAIRLIQGVLRQHTTLYHLGGDEYIFLFDTSSKNEVQNILNRVLRVFEREIVFKNIRTNISMSLGVVKYPDQGNTVEELIQNASLTLSQSQIRSTNNFAFYSSIIRQDLVSLQDFDNQVNTMDLNLFKVHFMPIASCKDNTIYGFECLTRAYNQFNELINTANVINSLERSGRIQELDTIVFKKVIEYKLQLNHDLPGNHLFLSVNASALSVNETFVDTIIQIYKSSGLSDGQVILELTESYKVEDNDYLIRLFKRLNLAGIQTSIDDFGSGYSSLSYISRFPIYSIKLDKEYVKNYNENNFNRTLFFTMRSIADVLNCKLIAEGVDDPETLDFLREHECPLYQGFLLSKGVEYNMAIKMIKQGPESIKE